MKPAGQEQMKLPSVFWQLYLHGLGVSSHSFMSGIGGILNWWIIVDDNMSILQCAMSLGIFEGILYLCIFY